MAEHLSNSWPHGSSEMARRTCAYDWAATPLGPIESWPPSLRVTVQTLLASAFPAVLLWGPDLVQVYNDGYRTIMADKHPAGLGQPTAWCWPEVWHINEPIYARVRAGETVTLEDALFPITRHGPLEEAWFTLCYSPVRDEAGAVGGVLVTVFETTQGHLAARRRDEVESALRGSEERQAFLLGLSDALRPIADPVDIQRTAARMLGGHLKASRVFYVEVEKDGDTATILGDYTDGVPSRIGRYSLSAFSTYAVSEWRAGRTARSHDVTVDPRYSEAEREAYASVSTRAGFGIPLVKEGRLVALLGVNQSTPRPWSDFDIGMASDVAERTWAAVERTRVEAALRESEARLAAAFESVPAGLAALDLEGRNILANAEYRRFLPTGFVPSRDPERGGRWRAWDRDGQAVAPQDYPVARALRGERVLPGLEMLYSDDDGREVWTNVATVPTYDEAGRVTGVVTVISDIDERKRADAALRESEERFAQFAASSSDALWIRDAATLAMEYTSPAIRAIYGVPPEALQGEPSHWAALIVPEDRDQALRHLEQARAGDAVTHEFRIQRPSDGAFRWIRNTDFPLRDEHGRVQRIGGIAEDVTEARGLREHERVLLAELQHRVRNTLGVVRSLARRTRVGSTSLDAYADTLSSRLGAFARVQSMVTRAADTGVDLGELMAEELRAHGAHEGERARIEGPEVRVRGRAADTLGLVVHELATNAVKHGALSSDRGCIDVTWTVQPGPDDGRLRLVWRESGAAIASMAPRRQGFGSELLGRQLRYELDAEAEVAYAPGGITCTITLPLARLAEPSA